MGRRKEDPALQAAKGYPGRRKGQTNREIEAAASAAEAETVAADPFAVPGVFAKSHRYYARATALWLGQAETLRTGGRRRPGYRAALTRYCIWMQIHESAMEQLRRDCPRGDFVVDWTPVNGSTRKIQHPSLKIMAQAEPILRALEDDFGFTPRADQSLVRNETFNRGQGHQGNLFGDAPASPRSPSAAPTASEGQGGPGDPMDLMNAADSAPPTLN